MGTSVQNSIMEKSSIVKDLANFDINAPVSVTICFEEDYEEIPIKTEPVVDDPGQDTPEIDNSAFVPILEPKKEIKSEKPASDLDAETDIVQDTTAHTPENVHGNGTNNEPKKRKDREENSIDHCKKSKHGAEDLNYANGLTNQPSNCASVDIELPSVETTANQAHNPGDLNELRQHELDKVNAYITNSLADVSEQLRRIMNAFDYHKRCQTPLGSFNEVKKKYFFSIYKTVATILLPQENNDIFMQTFLNDTVQRARKLAGPYYNRTYRDYANLLYELFMWVKQVQKQTAQTQNSANLNTMSGPPIEPQNNITTAPVKNNNNNLTVKDTQNINLPAKTANMSTEADKVCIFSSGLPGSEINPVISKYFKKSDHINHTANLSSSKNQPLSTNDNPSQVNTTAEYLAKFAAKYRKNTTQQPAVVSPTSQVPNVTVTHQELPKNVSRLMQNTPNHVLQPGAQTASLPQQVQELPKPPPPYHLAQMRIDQPQQQNVQYNQAPSSQPQIGQQQLLTMQYGQTNLSQSQHLVPQISPLQQLQTQFEQRQQITPQNKAKMHLQAQSRQNCQPMPQYIQSSISPQQRQPSQPQHQVHQQQRPADTWPSLVELLAREPAHAPSFPSFNPLNIQSKQTDSPNFDSWAHHSTGQMVPHNSQQQMPAQLTEWPQEMNMNYQIGQVPQITQKGAPRSASTDSGFISPLNFNVPADQTTPTTPLQDPECSIPVITHVTSLSDKVAFVEMGTCVVCHKNTKQMCMGCMKVYYCTYQCQSHDWNRHAEFCTAAQQHANYNGVQLR